MSNTKIKDMFFLYFFMFLVCPIWLPLIFFLFSNEPELGAGIDPGIALTPFHLVFWMRRDSFLLSKVMLFSSTLGLHQTVGYGCYHGGLGGCVHDSPLYCGHHRILEHNHHEVRMSIRIYTHRLSSHEIFSHTI